MTWLELGPFIGLGVLTNTAFPMPFEPVLVVFGGSRSGRELLLICAIGSLCAGLGALLDAGFFGVVRRGLRRRQGSAAPAAGPGFYWAAAAAGLLPIPFSIVRALLLGVRPRAALFAGIVVVTRFPRYVLTAQAWAALALPEWAGWVLAGTAGVVALEVAHQRSRRRKAASAAAGESRQLARGTPM
ncbi:MAG TPA: hypothetical protein VF037_06035 [Gemmatimonadales bacterium]